MRGQHIVSHVKQENHESKKQTNWLPSQKKDSESF